ncbi:hypothetical protein U1Q18_009467 [Sarracenia purpurea var. burkii]
MKDLSMKLLGCMEKALKIKDREVMQLFDGEGLQAMRMNYYPPCLQPELALGFSPHSDASAITILLQHNEVDGLQIKNDGHWIPIKPLPNAFIVNIGDIFEILTNGIYKSIEHRAIANKEKERISIGVFVSPRLDAPLGPTPSLVTSENPAMFITSTVDDYLKRFVKHEFRGKTFIESLRMRSEAEKEN